MSRPLTEGELLILREIQDLYGPHNSRDVVFFTDEGEAAIFVKDNAGRDILCAVLTNLADWYADGSIESRESLRRDWLREGQI
jgi:hypothetical protein